FWCIPRGNMEQRLAFLLNSCKSGNLPAQDQVELSDLITEYVVSDSHPDQEWSDDDFQSESDAERIRIRKVNGYGCKQIKVPGPAPGDMRRGCITQFSPEEIVALQLSVQDMERGELVVSFLFCTFHSILVFYY
uniref:hypothetical protein n=1 Tax=Thiolapillus sp. TaxID=2017437 RepID=UPI003AF53BB4